MLLGHKTRSKLIQAVKQMIYAEFPNSVVIWRGTGTPSDDYQDDTEVFEVYMIPVKDYEEFVDLKWMIRRKISEKAGVNISIRDLTPEETKEYRLEEYKTGLKQKHVWRTGSHRVGFTIKPQDEEFGVSGSESKLAECKHTGDRIGKGSYQRFKDWVQHSYQSAKTSLPDLRQAA